MADGFEWQKLRVHRENKFEDLVNKLCSSKNSQNSNAVFHTVKELMVFAALVGYQLDKFKPLESRLNSISISMETYATTDHDSYIYLIALTKSPSLEIIKDENLKDAIGIFEGFCNGGLHHIDNWLLINIGASFFDDVLFNETLSYLTKPAADFL